MLPRNVRHYFVINYSNSMMYGYMANEELGMIYNLPWLRPYLFCSQTEAQKIAKERRCMILVWPGRTYENCPTDNIF